MSHIHWSLLWGLGETECEAAKKILMTLNNFELPSALLILERCEDIAKKKAVLKFDQSEGNTQDK